MLKKLTALGLAELTTVDGRTIATLTPAGEFYQQQRRNMGRPPKRYGTIEDMSPSGRAMVRAQWAKADLESDDVGAPPYTHPASGDEKP